MSTEPRNLEPLRQSFKVMNRTVMVPMWQLGLGKALNLWPNGLGRFLVLVHRGRKSGTVYRTPVNYAQDGEHIIVMAGFGPKTDWYRNATAAGEADVWLPDGWWRVRVEDASDDVDRLRLYRMVLQNSGFAASTFEGIDPATITDAELATHGANWRLLRLHPLEVLSGEGGPGEYAWVWPVALVVLVLAIWLPRRHQSR